MALRLQLQSIRAELALIVVVLALPLVALIAYDMVRDAGREQSYAEGIVRRTADSTADMAARFVEDARLLLELRAVKSDPRLRTIPVVALTSSREEQDVVRSYELGVNAYVVKPVEFDKFLRAVRDLGLFWMLVNEPPPPARG